MKKDILKDFEILQENACVGSFFNKFAGLRPGTYLKRDPGTGVFL